MSNDVLVDREEQRKNFIRELNKALDILERRFRRERIRRFKKMEQDAEQQPDISLQELLRRNIGDQE